MKLILLTAIGDLTNLLMSAARAGLGLMGGVGAIRFLRGRADEDTRERSEGIIMMTACVLLEVLSLAVPKLIS
ncbi:MAG: hypothetical protein Q4F95_02070 [Oscillospiraceae bacterium]|nr:hypothetical protein [Oscillospiraceae bacterium]